MKLTRRQLLKKTPIAITMLVVAPVILPAAPEKVKRETRRYNQYRPGRHQIAVFAKPIGNAAWVEIK